MGEKKKRAGRTKRPGRVMRAVRRWVRRIIILCALVAAAMFALRAYIRSTADSGNDAQTYNRAPVVRGAMTQTVYGTGTTSARSQPSVLAGADGTLTDLRVSVGDEVRAGDVLAVLTNEELDDTITDLEFQLWELDDKIMGTGAGSAVREINSPVAGRVMAVYAEAGDDALAVFRREGALAIISTDGRMRVELSDLPAACGVALGDKLTVAGADFEVEGTVTDLTRQGTQATVTVIDDSLPMGARVSLKNARGDVVGEGALEVNKPMAVSSYGGTIRSVHMKVGDTVKRRDVLFRLEDSPLTLTIENLRLQRETAAKELSDAKTQRENLIVLAPCDGVVATLDVAEGDEITSGALLGSILEGEEMNLTIAVDELDVVSVAVGQSVVVTVDALGDAQLPGTVAKIAPVGSNAGGVTTYDVELTIDAAGSGVRSGMNATGEITVAATDDALYVPVEALMTINNQTFVLVDDGGQAMLADAAARFAQGGRGARGEGGMVQRGDWAQSGEGGMVQRGDWAQGGEGGIPQRGGAPQDGAVAAMAGAGAVSQARQEEETSLVQRAVNMARAGADAVLNWLYDGVAVDSAAEVSGTLSQVEVGLQNDDYAQIVSGVSEGDVVLYTGGTSAQSMFRGVNMNFGGMGGFGGMGR